MKKFDSESIYARLKDRAKKHGNFAIVAEDSTINALLKAQADGLSEISRYMEYLLGEKKWDTAQNTSSLVTMSKMIGHKPHRKQSAIGEVIVSHDPRLNDYGKTFFNLEQISDQDGITGINTSTPTDSQLAALRPYTSVFGAPAYTVTKGDVFSTNEGTQLIALQTKTIKNYTGSFSKSDVEDPAFSWEGYKYLKIPVIEGIVKTIQITVPSVVPDFLTLELATDSCESASNNYSLPFLKLNVDTSKLTSNLSLKYNYLGNLSSNTPWTAKESILLAGPYERAYEVYSSEDFIKVYFKFGDGSTGAKPPPGSIVTITYLETLGSKGNISNRFQVKNVNTIQTDKLSLSPVVLYVTNDVSILGGTELESIDEMKAIGPLEYLKYYSVGTVSAYETQIKSYLSSIDKVKAYGGIFTDLASGNSRDVVYLSAVNSVGEPIIKPAEITKFIQQVTDLIGDKKAPTDSLMYKLPSSVKLALNGTIYTSNRVLTSDEINNNITSILFSNYSIFSRNFLDPFYKSDLDYNINQNTYVKYSETFIETYVEVDFFNYHFDPINKMIQFDFQFDQTFAQDALNLGFKNKPNNNVQYLLRADLVWKNTTDSSADRTLFLLDSRALIGDTLSLRTAQYPITTDIVYTNRNMNNRVIPPAAQKEIKQYKYDTNGNNIIDPTTATIVADTRFIGNITSRKLQLTFNEEYDVNSPNFATGSIILPAVSSVNNGGNSYLSYSDAGEDSIEVFLTALKEQLSIKVYAQPVSTNLIPTASNVIISVDKTDINLEVVIV